MSASSGRFRVVNLGCKVNRVESDTLSAALLSEGYVLAEAHAADVVVVNTCTVTAEADTKARKAVRHALREDPHAHVIVTGCSVVMDEDIYRALDTRIICEPDKSRLLPLVRAHMGDISCTEPTPSPQPADSGTTCDASPCGISTDSPHPASPSHVTSSFGRVGKGFMSRAGIKVQDGCANACTYCIVHVARGPLWSKPLSEAVDEIAAAEAAGVEEVVLTGINLGAYTDLTALLADALASTSRLRIRLSSIEPLDVDRRLIELMAQSEGRICRHLHLPLQSGCDRTLVEMARPYDTSRYRELVRTLREAMPDLSLSCDVIAGFPGETDDDFERSYDFCEEMAFSKMHVFRYSRRPGTPAAARVDQVDPPVKAARSTRLRALAEEMRKRYASSLVGRPERLLLEASGKATSESYLDALRLDGTPFEREGGASALIDVEVAGSDGDIILCSPVR